MKVRNQSSIKSRNVELSLGKLRLSKNFVGAKGLNLWHRYTFINYTIDFEDVCHINEDKFEKNQFSFVVSSAKFFFSEKFSW